MKPDGSTTKYVGTACFHRASGEVAAARIEARIEPVDGAAEGCPPVGSCNNGWSYEDIYYVNWGNSPAYPFPQIYNEPGRTPPSGS